MVCGLNDFAVIDSNGGVVEFNENEKTMSVNWGICGYKNNIWLASLVKGLLLNILEVVLGLYGSLNKKVNSMEKNKFSYKHKKGMRVWNINVNRFNNVWITTYSNKSVICCDSKVTISKYLILIMDLQGIM